MGGSVFCVEQATVYRAGGRRWFTQKAAIKAYAAAKFRAKHPCECERGDYASDYLGFTCHVHDVRDRVLPRYIRVLQRAIKQALQTRVTALEAEKRSLQDVIRGLHAERGAWQDDVAALTADLKAAKEPR